MLSREPISPGISEKIPCIHPSGHTAQGSGVWGTRYPDDLALSRSGTYRGAGRQSEVSASYAEKQVHHVAKAVLGVDVLTYNQC